MGCDLEKIKPNSLNKPKLSNEDLFDLYIMLKDYKDITPKLDTPRNREQNRLLKLLKESFL